jgi:hypothetical protein
VDEGVSITYLYCFIEGEDTLYTIMAWTGQDQKSDFECEVKKVSLI